MDLGARPCTVFLRHHAADDRAGAGLGLAAGLHAVAGRSGDLAASSPARARRTLPMVIFSKVRLGVKPGHQRAGDADGAAWSRRRGGSSLFLQRAAGERARAQRRAARPTADALSAAQQAAGRRHHDLHGDVAPRGGARRRQSRAGISRLRYRSAARRRCIARRPCAQGHNQYAPMPGAAGAARADRARSCSARYGLPVDPEQRDHGDAGRDRGDLFGDPGAGRRGR